MREEFERLYQTYHHQLFQYLFYLVRNRETAEELVQEVYIKVLNSYETFEGKSSEKTWLYSIAKHVAIDWIRKQSRKKRRSEGKEYEWSEREFEIEDNEPLPEEIVVQKEEVQHIYKMLEKCSQDQQQVVLLRYIQSLSIAEAADILGWTESKVKTTQHRAIKALKRHLEEADAAMGEKEVSK
ncbi:RNA polymerase sigma factor SigX [Salipaludibacillus agaradhaerens]|uniref:RNA polymerase sigma factor n=1 Tax=Salipaludibacillus agaradhaerens TaxID=76935 RepID=A0A9Q4G0H0_SALAG|nr:RNA polymerase sigma factor SigX [Salipaludibacillus agaradhaerens]MCR6097819.1 RNA polymerase sigma factor SigX [Salipaludibacillus agaradhaerens]MCR6116552.1 RNA polymerase sigma factor SigX [Salipaludibacillus agaradhaerens]